MTTDKILLKRPYDPSTTKIIDYSDPIRPKIQSSRCYLCFKRKGIKAEYIYYHIIANHALCTQHFAEYSQWTWEHPRRKEETFFYVDESEKLDSWII